MHAVLDTNVLVSALRSSKGASAEILRLIHEAHIRIGITHNKNDFAPAASVGVKAITPAEALQILSKQ